MASFAKGISDEVPGPSALKKKSYRGGKAEAEPEDEEEETGSESLSYAKELISAVEDGDAEALASILDWIRGR